MIPAHLNGILFPQHPQEKVSPVRSRFRTILDKHKVRQALQQFLRI